MYHRAAPRANAAPGVGRRATCATGRAAACSRIMRLGPDDLRARLPAALERRPEGLLGVLPADLARGSREVAGSRTLAGHAEPRLAGRER